MKKLSYYVFALIVLLLVKPTGLSAQKYGIILQESFENGIPSDWTQECIVGNQKWIVEGGDTMKFPEGTTDGDKRIACRNTSKVTTNNITRLITPYLDLKDYYQPILCFSHAQNKWAGDVDTLIILYRTDEDREWIKLAEFDQSTLLWENDTIQLNAYISEKYQIAFEYRDNLGHGVTLDNIIIRSTPNCIQPNIMPASEITNNSAVILWNAGFDGIYYKIKISTTELAYNELYNPQHKADICDTMISAEKQYFLAENLEAGTQYYAYIKQICMNDSSSWSDVCHFSTTNTIDLPYHESFNISTTDYPGELKTWRFKSTDNTYIPYINSNELKSNLHKWSNDTSFSLSFCNRTNINKPIEANIISYAVTPMINIDDISKIEISFWSKLTELLSDYNKIIVGIMSDFNDISTFYPLDTIEVNQLYIPQEFIISTENYKGTGKYVAFMSNFEKSNQFFIDNLTIKTKSVCAKASNIHFSIKTADEALIYWDGNPNADIIISETPIDTNDISNTTMFNANTNPFMLKGLTPKTNYYLRIRNKENNTLGEWSNPVELRMPARLHNLPDTVDFKIDPNDNTTFYYPVYNYQNRYKLTNEVLTIINKRETGYPYCEQNINAFCLIQTSQCSSYTILPEITVDQCRIVFKGMSNKYITNKNLIVGVMQDVTDSTTFFAIDTITLTDDLQEYFVNITQHIHKGKFLSFKVNNNAIALISNVYFEKETECSSPTNLKYESITSSSVNIAWEANGMNKWHIRISDKKIPYDSLYSTSYQEYTHDTIVNRENITINGLKPNQSKYHCYISTICDNTTSNWIYIGEFATLCNEYETLPYQMNFENITIGEIPSCITTNIEKDEKGWTYPRTQREGSSNAIVLKSTIGENAFSNYIILPKVNIDDISKLELSMKIKNNQSTGIGMKVGLLSDESNISSMDSIGYIYVTEKNKWQEIVISFANYNGNKDKIAIEMPHGIEIEYLIDDIIIKEQSDCYNVQYPKAKVLSSSDVELSWVNGGERQWDIIIDTLTHTEIELNNLFNSENKAIYTKTIDSNPHKISGLIPGTEYYAYIRSRCGELTGKWTTYPAIFTTECAPIIIENIKVETFDNYNSQTTCPPCWIVGNANDIATAQNYIPIISDKYACSGKKSLFINSTTEFNAAYAIMPQIDTDNIRNLQVSFDASVSKEFNTASNCKKIMVGIITDPNDISTFVIMDTVSGYDDWQHYTIKLNKYNGDNNGDFGKYVMFMSEFPTKNQIYLDNIIIENIPTCTTPNIKSYSVTTNTITIETEESLNQADLILSESSLSVLELDQQNNSLENIIVINNYNGDKIKFESLKPATDYYLYIRCSCETEKSKWSDATRISTDCNSYMEIPFSDNFNNYNKFGIAVNPKCWTCYYSNTLDHTNYPSLTKDENNESVLYIYTLSSRLQSYAITPEIKESDLTKCQVSFTVRGDKTYESRNIIVGMVSDISGGTQIENTFEPIDTILIFNTAVYKRYEINLDKYTGNGRFICFTSSFELNDFKSGGVYLDDINIDYISSCPKPTNIKLQEKSDSNLVFSFSETQNADSWEVQYGTTGFKIGEGDIIGTTDTIVSINNLSAKTSYDIYIRSKCAQETSPSWSGPYTYTTTPTPISSFPYTIKFDNPDENNNWILVGDKQYNSWYIGKAENLEDNSLYISSNQGISSIYDIDRDSKSWARRPIFLKEGDYDFKYDWNCFGEDKMDFIRIGLIPVTAQVKANSGTIIYKDNSFESISSYNNNYKGFIALEGNSNGKQLTKLSAEEKTITNNVALTVTKDMVGLYDLVVFWSNNASKGNRPEPAAFLNNIEIYHTNCVVPLDIEVTNITDNQADIKWNIIGETGNYTEWEVFVTNNTDINNPDEAQKGDTVCDMTVNTPKLNVGNLQPYSQYNIFIRSICGSSYSDWSAAIPFMTLCSPFDLGTCFDLETKSQINPKLPDCFESYHMKPNGHVSFVPQLVNSSTTVMSYNNSSSAITVYYNDTTQAGGFVVLPLINSNINEVQVSFWMRPFIHNKQTGKISTATYTEEYAKSITVGTIEDINDLSTYQEIQICRYTSPIEIDENSIVTDDPNGNEYWQKFIVPIKNIKNKRIVLLCDEYENYSKNRVYIDDICIDSLVECSAPFDINVENISDTAIDISFNSIGGIQWITHIASEANMSDTVFLDTINEPGNISIKNLTPNTEYYISIKQVCDDDLESEWSSIKQVSTYATLKFEEKFEVKKRVPLNWARSNMKLEDVLNGEQLKYISDIEQTGWTHSSNNEIYETNHQYINLEGYLYAWIISPIINIKKNDKVHLGFDATLTNKNSMLPIYDYFKGCKNKKFKLLISGDAGNTWKEEDVISWGNNNDEYKLDNLSGKWNNFVIDMTKFAGKNIRLAFYAESKKGPISMDTTYDIHIDNFLINYYNELNVNDSICEHNDYIGEITVKEEDMHVGNNNYYINHISMNNMYDTIYNLNLNVKPMSENILPNATVCEGEPYNENGFNVTAAGTYKRKLQAANGCDSVIVLNLDVIPAKRVEKTDSICVGGKYTWNGDEYTKPGVYSDTLTSKETGCDSIVTLTLLPIKEITVNLDTAICYGGTLKIGKEEIVESGNHTVRLESVQGCDSVINVSLTILPEYRSTTNAVICKGDSYSDDIFKGLKEDTFTKMTVDSKEKCDSTVTLNLVVIENGVDKEVTVDISVNDLPYRFFDREFGQDTKPGTYTEEMELGNGNCKATVRLTLNVSDEVGYVPTSTVKELVLTPNPINAGEEVTVNAEFTEAELSDMTVEVYTSSGTKVMSFRPESEPVTINGLTVSGVYMVRITTGEGTVYQGKIVVR